MKISESDIRNMIMESVRRTLLMEEVNNANFIYLVFPVALYSSDLRKRLSGHNFKVTKAPTYAANLFYSQYVDTNKKPSALACLIFYDGGENVGHDRLFNEMYGNSPVINKATIGSERDRVNEALAILDRFGIVENENMYIYTRPLRKYKEAGEAPVEAMVNKKCLLLSNLMMETDSPYGTPVYSIGRAISWSLSRLRKDQSSTLNSNSATALARWKNWPKNEYPTDFKTYLYPANGRVETIPTDGNSGYIGISWRFNDEYTVVQFLDDADDLYTMILSYYNKIGLKKIAKTKANHRGMFKYEKMDPGYWDKNPSAHKVKNKSNLAVDDDEMYSYYGFDMDNAESAVGRRSLHGLASYYQLYTIDAHSESDDRLSRVQLGTLPEIRVDFALFNDINDLMCWYREWTELQSEMSAPAEKKARNVTMNSDKEEFRQILYDMYDTSGPEKPVRRLWLKVQDILDKSFESGKNLPFSYIWSLVTRGEDVGGILAPYITHGNTINNATSNRLHKLSRVIQDNSVKKLFKEQAMMYMDKLRESAQGQGEDESLQESITMDEIGYMILESVKRIINGKRN